MTTDRSLGARLRRGLLTLVVVLLAVQSGIAIMARYREFLAKGQVVASFLFICVILVVAAAFALLLLWAPQALRPLQPLKRLPKGLRALIAFVLCLLPTLLYTFHRWSEPYSSPWIRVSLILFAILLAGWTLDEAAGVHFSAVVHASLLFAVPFVLISQFRDVSAYPFSIGWSEGNRIWDYSVLFGRHLYNWPQDVAIPAYIDLGRQSLWGSIFLLPNVSIAGMRSWNDFLFTIPCALAGWALLRRNTAVGKGLGWIAALWAMLFLLQGPIYTPLILALILVAIGRRLPLPLACLLTALASAYAVMSRSTWIIGPAVYAGMLLLIEPIGKLDSKIRWRNALLVGFCGLIGAVLFLKQDVIFGGTERAAAAEPPAAALEQPDALTGTDESAPGMFTPEGIRYFLTRQPLLWNRLLPNETYPRGILLGLLLAILPICLMLVCWVRSGGWQLTLPEKIILWLILLGFLSAGLLISVKIGGGSNLHNLDLFLIALLVLAALAWNAGMGEWLRAALRRGHWLGWVALAAILLPVSQDALQIEPKKYPVPETTADALSQVQQIVAANREEPVLFMDQRQLLTFDAVEKIPLIADYEKKWMMDEAMADNAAWFAPYWADLKAQRFAVIISEPLHIRFQGADLNFSEENDRFVQWVSLPTLCFYEPLETFEAQGVQILVPRTEPLEQEGVVCP